MKNLILVFLIFMISCSEKETPDPVTKYIYDTIYHNDTVYIPIDSTLYDVVFESYCIDPSFVKKWDILIKVHNDSLYFNQVQDLKYFTKAFKYDYCEMAMDSIHTVGYYGMRIIINDSVRVDTFYENPGWAKKVKISCIVN